MKDEHIVMRFIVAALIICMIAFALTSCAAPGKTYRNGCGVKMVG
jgi:hypothetical protein